MSETTTSETTTGWTAASGLAEELERIARNLGAVHGRRDVSEELVDLAHRASELAKRVDA